MNDTERELWAVIKDGMITPEHLDAGKTVPARLPTWHFKTLEPSGTVVATDPLGKEFIVAGGRFDTAAGRKLLNAMIDDLTGKCTRIAHTPDGSTAAPSVSSPTTTANLGL